MVWGRYLEDERNEEGFSEWKMSCVMERKTLYILC
jgi:hypothetical protein